MQMHSLGSAWGRVASSEGSSAPLLRRRSPRNESGRIATSIGSISSTATIAAANPRTAHAGIRTGRATRRETAQADEVRRHPYFDEDVVTYGKVRPASTCWKNESVAVESIAVRS